MQLGIPRTAEWPLERPFPHSLPLAHGRKFSSELGDTEDRGGPCTCPLARVGAQTMHSQPALSSAFGNGAGLCSRHLWHIGGHRDHSQSHLCTDAAPGSPLSCPLVMPGTPARGRGLWWQALSSQRVSSTGGAAQSPECRGGPHGRAGRWHCTVPTHGGPHQGQTPLSPCPLLQQAPSRVSLQRGPVHSKVACAWRHRPRAALAGASVPTPRGQGGQVGPGKDGAQTVMSFAHSAAPTLSCAERRRGGAGEGEPAVCGGCSHPAEVPD